jgi:small GTP-binding protein
VVKVAFVGSGGAGKTTLASRLVSGEFIQTMMTAGINIETWSITDEETGGEVKVALFDLGGQPRFRFFQASLLVGTHAVLIVVDMTRPRSLFEVDTWVSMIRHVPKERWLLVGNKCDESVLVSEDEVRQKANELGVPYVIVSAKTGENFDRLVEAAAAAITSH